jgi:molecular chaperone DnaK (HSP70)
MSVVGFDFGSQTSFCAVARQGGIEVVANEYSKRATETVVSLGDKMRFMGTAGHEKRISKIKTTVTNFKRLIGLPFEHPLVQERVNGSFPTAYQLVKDEATGMAAVNIPGCGTYNMTQITAMFLGKMKEIADSNLGRSVEDCVITCPVFYGEDQRRALQDAAHISGLRPLQIMSETTAAALAYGIYKQDLPEEKEPSRNVVFVDFGYNSLQVTSAAMNKGKLTILGSAWDESVGGYSFDKVIWQKMNEDFIEKYKVDTRKNNRAQVKLIEASEKVKKTMSANSIDIPLNLECLMDDKDVHGKINRAHFEEISEGLIQRIKQTLINGLEKSGLKKEELYSVEVMGGASRMPCFKQAVKEVFNMEPSTTLNTDEAACRGAALKCAILSPTFRVREFNIVDSVINEVTINWSADGTGANSGTLKLFENKGPFPFTKAMTIFRKTNDDIEISAALSGEKIPIDLCKYKVSGITALKEDEEKGKKVKLYFRMDGSGFFLLSYAEQIERFEEWVEVPVEKPKEEPKKDEKSEKPKEESGEPMETDGQTQPENAEKMDTSQTSEDGEKAAEAAPEPEVKKEKKIKQRKTPLKLTSMFQYGALNEASLNNYLEVECQLRSTDKEERDKSDAKNSLEELVYAIRDRLYGKYDGFIQEVEKSNLNKQCDELEDWLYGDGEDQPKNVYSDRRSNLQAVVTPVDQRIKEFEGRPKALERLTDTLNKYQKIVGECQAQVPDSKFAHLSPEDVQTMNKACADGWKYYSEINEKLKSFAKDQDPTVTIFDINAKSNYIDNVSKPIASKKPPKVEPPKEEEKKPDEEAKQASSEESKPQEDEKMDSETPNNTDDLD